MDRTPKPLNPGTAPVREMIETQRLMTERAHLLAILSRIYECHAERIQPHDPDYAFELCIHFPWGEAAFPMSNDEFMHILSHIELQPAHDLSTNRDEFYRLTREAVNKNRVR